MCDKSLKSLKRVRNTKGCIGVRGEGLGGKRVQVKAEGVLIPSCMVGVWVCFVIFCTFLCIFQGA